MIPRHYLTNLLLVSLVVGLVVQAPACQANKKKHVHHVHHTRRRDTERQRVVGPSIDALDESKCGEANFRPWQKKQSAFGCSTRPRQREPQDTGRVALRGEFPFHVGIEVLRRSSVVSEIYGWNCSGVLVNRDTVLTTAECVWRQKQEDPFEATASIRLSFGSSARYKKGESIERFASRACWPTEALPNRGDGGPAAIKLKKPVEYAAGKIGPVCLRRPSGRGNTTTKPSQCSQATFCSGGAGGGGSVNWARDSDQLNSLVVERAGGRECAQEVSDTCYKRQDEELSCEPLAQRGSGIFCYDKCSGANVRAKVRAYLTGFVSPGRWPYDESPAGTWWPPVLELAPAWNQLMSVLRAVHEPDTESRRGVTCAPGQDVW